MKKKGIILFLIIILISGLLTAVIFGFKKYMEEITLKKVEYEEDYVMLLLNKNGDCAIDETKSNWIETDNKKCKIYLDEEKKSVFVRNKMGRIFTFDINESNKPILDFSLSFDKTYLAVGGVDSIKYTLDDLRKLSASYKSEDETIASVSSDGIITGISPGKTNVVINILDISKKIEVEVSNLIIPAPSEFDYNKEYLTCNKYTAEDNDKLDEILKYRVQRGGENTRAGVVEAARFITLEMPYRFSYFSENGRLGNYGGAPYVDGEGRYYHKGLYLHESRYVQIEKSMNGPMPWGCMLYSSPSGGIRKNGFDCSGFISWVLYNCGFDVEDVGAGVSSYKDLTDLGHLVKLSDAISNDTLRVGDLLSGKGVEGGHIALLAGKKDGYYYVAESLWHGGKENGAQLKKYDSNTIFNSFYWQVDMNDYYKVDGNLTDYWKN